MIVTVKEVIEMLQRLVGNELRQLSRKRKIKLKREQADAIRWGLKALKLIQESDITTDEIEQFVRCEDCRVIKRLGTVLQHDGVCEGFGVSEINDETLLAPCAKCTLNSRYIKPEPKRKRKFTWDRWNYDCDGEAYIIAKDECPTREEVPEWIVNADNLSLNALDGNNPSYISRNDVKEGWCKFQVRTDWDNGDGEPRGGYTVTEGERPLTAYYQGGQRIVKVSPGWFPVWIIRLGDWY